MAVDSGALVIDSWLLCPVAALFMVDVLDVTHRDFAVVELDVLMEELAGDCLVSSCYSLVRLLLLLLFCIFWLHLARP